MSGILYVPKEKLNGELARGLFGLNVRYMGQEKELTTEYVPESTAVFVAGFVTWLYTPDYAGNDARDVLEYFHSMGYMTISLYVPEHDKAVRWTYSLMKDGVEYSGLGDTEPRALAMAAYQYLKGYGRDFKPFSSQDG